MAIKPNDCLTEKRMEQFREMEKAVDKYLMMNYRGKELYMGHIINIPEGSLRKAICELYREAGWEVMFKADPQGGMAAYGPIFVGKDDVVAETIVPEHGEYKRGQRLETD